LDLRDFVEKRAAEGGEHEVVRWAGTSLRGSEPRDCLFRILLQESGLLDRAFITVQRDIART
jgi:hypothetical protein